MAYLKLILALLPLIRTAARSKALAASSSKTYDPKYKYFPELLMAACHLLFFLFQHTPRYLELNFFPAYMEART